MIGDCDLDEREKIRDDRWDMARLSAFLLTAVAAVCQVATTLSAQVTVVDWPGWRGPIRAGISPEIGWNSTWPAGGPRILWKAAVGTGFSSLAVVGGRAYTLGNASGADTVYCLDAENGNIVWKHSYPCSRRPLSYEGGPSATPAVDAGQVFTLSKFGHCFCLDAASGEVLWSKKFEPPSLKLGVDYPVFWGFAGSPLVLGEKLILAVGTACTALNKADGRLLWSSPPGRPGYSSPVPFQIGNRLCVAQLSGHEAVAVDVDTGQILWKIPWKTTWDQNAPDVIVAEGKLFVTTGHGVGCALFDFSTGVPRELWRNKNMRCDLSSCVLWNGCLYGFDQNRLTCLDWRTGQVRWSVRGLGRGTLIASDGRLIALGDDGKLVIAEASSEGFRPLAETKILSGRCWTAPVLSAGRIYARNAAGDVVCVDVRR